MIRICFGNLLPVISLLYCIVEIDTIHVGTTIPQKLNKVLKTLDPAQVKSLLNDTRRIIIGSESKDSRPYMVYLKLPTNSPKYKDYKSWLCGGVIVHGDYILTSAACIEDARHFYVVSGTPIYESAADRFNNMCIKNGARKAIWKCVPRNYIFDGHENDNIRWMNNDIAIVKVDEEFDFTRRVRGCDYIPRPICYNNQSQNFEEPGRLNYIAGWGSTSRYNEEVQRQVLMESEAVILNKRACKNRWGQKYSTVIDNYMICTKDIIAEMSEICSEKYVDCSDINYDSLERRSFDTDNAIVHSANHKHNDLRRLGFSSGGFCENDHGGPLIAGTGVDAMVIGVISACLVKEGNLKCYGPFLYTSVYKNRVFITCAIYNDAKLGCDKLFRADETHVEEVLSWKDHPDGPAKTEINRTAAEEAEYQKYKNTLYEDVQPITVTTEAAQQRRSFAKKVEESTTPINPSTKDSDKPLPHSGIVFRSFSETQPPTSISPATHS